VVVGGGGGVKGSSKLAIESARKNLIERRPGMKMVSN